ncbi:MAG: hypothetical protein JW793_02535 [Acidobacteria bacterium]|nr:hypothetical protein [Acidobacteriota bacterium]
MSLYGSIKEVQSAVEQYYLNLAQRFSENKLIGTLWGQMARDVSQQIRSLHELPKSLWARLQKDQSEWIEKIRADIKPQDYEIKRDISLSNCIDTAIRSEEAVILKIYVPIIRNLRKNWTGQALDFYIMVKAHAVRIQRAAQSFSGDPAIMQHANLLFQEFEKEIQEPEIEIIQKIKPALKSGTDGKIKPEKNKIPAKTKPEPATRAMPGQKADLRLKAKPKIQAKAKAKSKTKAGPKLKTKPAAPVKKKAKEGKVKEKSSKQRQSPIGHSKIRRSPVKTLAEKADLRRRRARR